MRATSKLIPVGLRLPKDLADWLRQEAQRNQRSVANQTAWALQQYRQQLERQGAAQ